jgi:hemerythrin-like domain-containing protein
MAEMGAITLAMLKQHQIIDKCLFDFDKIPEEDSPDITKLFQIFQWNLDKHIFIEEANIFPIADENNKTEMRQIQNLLKDHKDLRAIIKDLYEEVEEGRKPNTKILRELLSAHEEREIQSFYPLLDKRLSIERKRDILTNLKDVRIG